MAIRKSELYSSLWKSCDELRGGMDASQYKDYVLVLLFVKYVSDKYAGRKDALLDVPPGGSFTDMVALKGDKEIGDKINIIIGKLAEANELKGVIDVADFNDPDKLGKGKEMVDRLSNLVAIFDTPALDFRSNRAEGDDILGDAYEYLMRHFATESGKSKGQFYTPAEVSRIMAKVVGIGNATRPDQSLYDPTCGSGSLLIKAHDEARGETGLDLAIYGQEMDNATAALAKMNMILHDCPTAEIWQDNSLSSPYFKHGDGSLKTFDFVFANPPFSTKAWSNGFDPANDEYGRFTLGIPPAKNGDYAFLLHIIASLKSTGKGAVILPHGVLFRGNVEADIRKQVIRRGYIKGIVGLPANLFYGTSIPACIIVLDKENAAARKGIFMIDASKGFIKDGNKNRLRAQDIHKIVDVFNRQIETDKYARMVPLAEIETNDYNLNIPRYIDSTEPEDLQDIDAHLKGGIPNPDIDALERYWAVMPGLRSDLFAPADRPGYATPKVEPTAVKPTIHDHAEFKAYSAEVAEVFEGWRAANIEAMRAFDKDSHPKALIHDLSEDLLVRFDAAPLIDMYDIYQRLMTYWDETMQDDAYLIALEGWESARTVRELVKNSDGKFSETPDLTIGKRKLKADLIPPALIVAQFYVEDKAALEAQEAAMEDIMRQIEEMDEEHGAEDGLLADAKTDQGKLTAASLKARIKKIKGDALADDERQMLHTCVAIIDKAAVLKRALKKATDALNVKTLKRYGTLTEMEAKVLVVEDKWLPKLANDVQSELGRVSQALTGRIKLLTERYATPLPRLTEDVASLGAKVDTHLQAMGFAWN